MKRFLVALTIMVFCSKMMYGQVKATTVEVNTGTDDAKFITPLALQGSKYLDQNGGKTSAIASGSANVYTATIEPAITGYNPGQIFYVKITAANTGPSTLNLNGLGAKALVKDANAALVSGDLLANKVYEVYYDGVNFQVLNAVSGTTQSAIAVAANKLLGRYAGTSGSPQDITLGGGLMLTPSGLLHVGNKIGASASNVLKVSNPTGGQYRIGSISTTGAIRIQLPSNSATMYTIKGTIYQYNIYSTSFSITCYGSSMSSGYSATFTGNNAPNYPVRWYTNGTTPAVYIGDVTSNWTYLSVTIDEVQGSHSGATIDGSSSGWQISLEPAFTGTLAATQLNTLPYSNLTQPITGYVAGANTALSATDNMLDAFGKLQGQINLVYSPNNLKAVYGGGTSGATDANTFLNGHTASYYTLNWLANGYFTGNAGYGGLIAFPQKTGNGTLQLNYSWGHGTTTGGGIAFRTQKLDGTFTTWKELWHSGNLNDLSQLATRNFSDLQNKPTTLSGFGITDGATQASVTTMDANVVHKTGNESIAGTKLFSNSVGIGTTNTLSYKLAVGGGIIAESVKVKPQSGWADYVFEKGYPILPLKDLEHFILKNKHLPGIPTASEVKKEGIDLGEINTRFLQKIEELTLYLIDLKKENEGLKKENELLKKETNEKIRRLSEMVKKLSDDLHTTSKNNEI